MKPVLLGACVAILLALFTLTPVTLLHMQARQQASHLQPPVWPIPEDATEARKARLINILLPAIQDNNRTLLDKRERLQRLQHQIERGRTLSRRDQEWLTTLSNRYQLDPPEQPDVEWLALLLRRIDIIPADLALAQGALESGWGESRFAIEANNYFGHWCWRPGCGLVPSARPEGARYEVEVFSSAHESVRRYMHNLNSHPRYRQLRLIRERAREEGRPITGAELAAGLEGYAQTGAVYIEQVRGMIRWNQFDQYQNH